MAKTDLRVTTPILNTPTITTKINSMGTIIMDGSGDITIRLDFRQVTIAWDNKDMTIKTIFNQK